MHGSWEWPGKEPCEERLEAVSFKGPECDGDKALERQPQEPGDPLAKNLSIM